MVYRNHRCQHFMCICNANDWAMKPDLCYVVQHFWWVSFFHLFYSESLICEWFCCLENKINKSMTTNSGRADMKKHFGSGNVCCQSAWWRKFGWPLFTDGCFCGKRFCDVSDIIQSHCATNNDMLQEKKIIYIPLKVLQNGKFSSNTSLSKYLNSVEWHPSKLLITYKYYILILYLL